MLNKLLLINNRRGREEGERKRMIGYKMVINSYFIVICIFSIDTLDVQRSLSAASS